MHRVCPESDDLASNLDLIRIININQCLMFSQRGKKCIFMQFTHQNFIKPKWKEQTVHYCWSVSHLLLFEALLLLGVKKQQREKDDTTKYIKNPPACGRHKPVMIYRGWQEMRSHLRKFKPFTERFSNQRRNMLSRGKKDFIKRKVHPHIAEEITYCWNRYMVMFYIVTIVTGKYIRRLKTSIKFHQGITR